MRSLTLSTLVALLLCGALTTQVLAQRGVGRQQGVAQQADKPALETFTGTVAEIKIGPCEATTGHGLVGVHLMLNSEDGDAREVHLGPQAAVQDVVANIEIGQTLSVTGFSTSELPADVLVAKSITNDQQTFDLRSDSLQPVWAGGAGPGVGRGLGRGQGRGQGAQFASGGWGRGGGRGMGPAMQQGPQVSQQGWGRGMGPGRGQGCYWAPNSPQYMQGRAMGPGQGRGRQGNGFRGGRGGGPGAWPAAVNPIN